VALHMVDLKLTLDAALKPLQARISQQQATVIIEGDLPVVTIGSDQLGLVLHNLVDNALLYAAPERPLAIYIIGRIKGDQVGLVVADNGVGFEPAAKEAIFDAFRDRSQHAGQQRTGVGLAVCRRIMDQLQGSIDVTPVMGQGCTFSLRFLDRTVDSSLGLSLEQLQA
jgi:light-regulated signal transduction histidine kinase (bacteriophytochrome)